MALHCFIITTSLICFPSSLRLLTSLLVMTKILNLQKNKKYMITLQKINKILME